MDWQPFESKLLTSSAYDAVRQTLYLRFRSGEVYRYFAFPQAQYREFLDAESRGRYFLNHIRNHSAANDWLSSRLPDSVRLRLA